MSKNLILISPYYGTRPSQSVQSAGLLVWFSILSVVLSAELLLAVSLAVRDAKFKFRMFKLCRMVSL